MTFRDYSSTEEMLGNYAEIRKRLYDVPPQPKPPAPSIEELLPEPAEKPELQGIAELRAKVREIAEAHGVPFEAIFSKGRTRRIVEARQKAMVEVAKMREQRSVVWIARFFGRDHTTVLYAFKSQGYAHGRPSVRDKRLDVTYSERRRLGAERLELWREGKAPHPSDRAIRKLNVDQVIEIRSREGEPSKTVAADYGVSRNAIYRIWKREIWKHVK